MLYDKEIACKTRTPSCIYYIEGSSIEILAKHWSVHQNICVK